MHISEPYHIETCGHLVDGIPDCGQFCLDLCTHFTHLEHLAVQRLITSYVIQCKYVNSVQIKKNLRGAIASPQPKQTNNNKTKTNPK